MRISRVELWNIKSYVQAEIDLQGGVIAIRGHNGAGKTTLLEAIGWALFGYLPYTQQQFVREGETSGKVVVTFISPLDDRPYEVTRRCGARADWTVFDRETGERIESNADVTAFLRRHMRIEGSIELKELFTGALGAPQGQLTADFSATSKNRKAKFDALLQVEDYVKAAEKLGKTSSHLREQSARQDERIAALEREVAPLDQWRADREQRIAEQGAATLRLDALDGEIEAVEALVERLRQAQGEVTRREGVARVAEATHIAARQSQEQATQALRESQAATQILAETRADHETHVRAEGERAAAQRRVQQRDALLAKRAEAAQRRERASGDAGAAETRLGEIALAEQRIVTFQEPLAQQVELERARDTASQNTILLGETRKTLARLSAQRAPLERALAERERDAAAIEAQRPLAADLAARRARVTDLQALAATRQQSERRQMAVVGELAEVADRRAKASAAQARQRENLRKLEEYRPIAEALPQREQEKQAADDAVRVIVARLQQNRQSRELSGAGNCPFLREPCKNIQARGENDLGVYFDRLIAADEAALAPAQAQLATANERVAKARKAAEYYARLDEYRASLEQAEASLADCAGAERRLGEERDALSAALAAAGDTGGLAEAQRLLGASEEADRRLATLPAILSALEETRANLADLAHEMTRHEATQGALAGAPDAERAAVAKLAKLGDPRGEIAKQRGIAEARPEVEQRLTDARARQALCDAELARHDADLAPFASLNDDIAALDLALREAAPGHIRYLQHERTADRLAERTTAHAAAVERAAAAAAEAQAAAQALAEAQARFDPQALAGATTQANDLRSERGRLRESQRHLAEQVAALGERIAQGEVALEALERARVERGELDASRQMLEQFRATLKEAGPLVTQRLLSQVSAEANNIFGEIIGDRAAELAWVDDYEIVLRRGSSVRTFTQLSGGEQMAAALATRLALLRRLTGLDMAFFDEPTQNMDAERRGALAEQIRRVHGFEQLIVISHDDTFEQGLDSVIHLEKRGGATVVSDDVSAFATAVPFPAAEAGLLGARLDATVSALAPE